MRQYKNGGIKLISEREKFNILYDIGRKLSGYDAIDGAWVLSRLDEIGAFKNTGKLPDHYDEEEERDFLAVASEYKRRMRSAGLIDFEDMILDCVELLQTHPKILLKLQHSFSHILVDEFQDCNDPQYELLLLLSAGHRNLFCVGDDDQSIYGFRGANSAIIRRLMEDHPDLQTVNLIRNYRCPAAVIDAATALITKNTLRITKPKQQPSKLRTGGSVTVLEVKDAKEEACVVAERIKSLLLQGSKPCDIAILYRTEQCAILLREKLIQDGLLGNVKEHQVFSGNFYETEIVREVEAYLYLSQSVYQREYFFRILNHPDRNLVRECIGSEPAKDTILRYYADDPVRSRALKDLFEDLDYLSNLPVYAAIHYIWKKTGLGLDYAQNRLRAKRDDLPDEDEVLRKLCEQAKPFGSIKRFLGHMEKERIKTQLNDRGERRRNDTGLIMQTIHAAKGLEYDTVFVIGLQEGILPHIRAGSLEEREEERRLLYVAMTRARNNLYLCARGNKDCGKRYSSFIKEIKE